VGLLKGTAPADAGGTVMRNWPADYRTARAQDRPRARLRGEKSLALDAGMLHAHSGATQH